MSDKITTPELEAVLAKQLRALTDLPRMLHRVDDDGEGNLYLIFIDGTWMTFVLTNGWDGSPAESEFDPSVPSWFSLRNVGLLSEQAYNELKALNDAESKELRDKCDRETYERLKQRFEGK